MCFDTPRRVNVWETSERVKSAWREEDQGTLASMWCAVNSWRERLDEMSDLVHEIGGLEDLRNALHDHTRTDLVEAQSLSSILEMIEWAQVLLSERIDEHAGEQ